MPTYNSGSSNYPLNYDLNPTGSTTPTVEYLLDQIRDSGTGVVSQSGDTVVALNVNSVYTILQKIEETLGIDPAGSVDYGFNTVAERFDYLQSVSGLAFLPSSGGTLFGTLVMSGTQAINANTLNSSGLVWTITSGASIGSSGTLTLLSSGNVVINATGSTLSLSATTLTSNFNNSQIYAANINQLSGNTISLLSNSGVTFNNHILTSASLVNIGSTGTPFENLYVNNIISTGLGGINSYVAKSGDTMTGDLVFNSGVSIMLLESGTSELGSSNLPFSGIYTKTLYASFISGLSPITFNSDIVLASGLGLTFSSSGSSNLGTTGNRIGTVYADVINANTISFNGYVNESGDSMTGNLTFTSGNSVVLQSGSIYPSTSGVGTVGTTGNYFSNIYTNQINGRNAGSVAFNEEAGGTADGVNKTFTLAHAPLNGYAMIFVSGILINPVTHYEISGTTLQLTGSMYAPTSKPIAGFYIF